VALQANVIADHARGIQLSGAAPTTTVSTAHTLFSNVGLPYLGFTGSASDITSTVAFVDAAGFDYHLAPGSPGADAAPDYGLAADFEGDPRPQGAGFDIGFDEAAALYRVYLPAVLRQP
jgi:hypothetical protein